MRGLFNAGRGLVVLMAVVCLAAPVAEAKPKEKERKPSKIVQVLKNLIGTLGDGLIIPRP